MENLQKVKSHLKDHAWFYDVGTDEWQRPVVYVHYMGTDIFETISKVAHEFSVLSPCIYFASSITFNKSKVVNYIEPASFVWNDDAEPELDSEPGELQTGFLLEEIGRLRAICGSNILSDIFYEVHDGKNAITNLSVKFPEIRESLNNLYFTYGFDVLYEQVDC